MRTGTIKFFNESKGYGFVTDDETGKDIFIHASGVKAENLSEGDKINFELEEGRKGKIAVQTISTNQSYLSLYFSLEEFSQNEISEIISNLSEIYASIGGDSLVIKGIQLLEYKPTETPVLM